MRIASYYSLLAGLLFVGFLGCKDGGSLPPAPRPTGSLSAGLDTLFTFPQDTIQIAISGGILPYSVQSLTSSTIVQYAIPDSTLRVLPTGLGSDIARITDASSPAKQIDLPVVVGTAVSFSNSIQPIFVSSYGCSGAVNGCHGGTMGMATAPRAIPVHSDRLAPYHRQMGQEGRPTRGRRYERALGDDCTKGP